MCVSFNVCNSHPTLHFGRAFDSDVKRFRFTSSVVGLRGAKLSLFDPPWLGKACYGFGKQSKVKERIKKIAVSKRARTCARYVAVYDASSFIEMITPFYPQRFLLLATVANCPPDVFAALLAEGALLASLPSARLPNLNTPS